MNIFGPKRPLNPLRKHVPPSRVTFKPTYVENFKIIVNVLRASGVPQRLADQSPATRRSSVLSSIHSLSHHFIQSFLKYI